MTSLNESDSFHQVRNQKSVDDKAGGVDALYSGFVHGLAPVEHSLEDFVRSVISFNNFEKFHHRNGIEEVKTAKSAGIL